MWFWRGEAVVVPRIAHRKRQRLKKNATRFFCQFNNPSILAGPNCHVTPVPSSECAGRYSGVLPRGNWSPPPPHDGCDGNGLSSTNKTFISATDRQIALLLLLLPTSGVGPRPQNCGEHSLKTKVIFFFNLV